MFKTLKDLLAFDTYDQVVKKRPRSTLKCRKTEVFDFLHLINLWPDIVGNVLSKHTIPLKHKSGVLTILSNHSAFSHQLSFMQEVLLKKITKTFPQLSGKIKKINFQVNSTFFNEKILLLETQVQDKPKSSKRPELHPYSPQYRQLKALAEKEFIEIVDNDLKETLISLYIQNKVIQN